jgi:hypothetical protein
MGKVWVKAKSIVRIEENGKMITFHPGDWVRMGRQQAREYLVNDQIEILKSAVLQSVQNLTNCAILLRDGLPERQTAMLTAKYPALPIQKYTGEFPQHGRFLLWDTTVELKRELILTGFKLLEKWQLAVPLLDYSILAENIGTAQEREETEAIIHDLRVPVYNTRVLFVRQCQETRKLFELWDSGSQLKFLQALYQSRPVVNALPPSWVLK